MIGVKIEEIDVGMGGGESLSPFDHGCDSPFDVCDNTFEVIHKLEECCSKCLWMKGRGENPILTLKLQSPRK